MAYAGRYRTHTASTRPTATAHQHAAAPATDKASVKIMIAGECCAWTEATTVDDEGDGADIISPVAPSVSVSVPAAASASAPTRRIRRRRQSNQNAANGMLSRLIYSTADGGSCGGGSADAVAVLDKNGSGGADSALSIASTSGSSSSSSTSSSNCGCGGNVGNTTLANSSSRACSISPAFSHFPSKSSSFSGGILSNSLQCHALPTLGNPSQSLQQSHDQQQQELEQQQQCASLAPSPSTPSSHFLPSDFTPQTWLSAVHETVSSTTVRYCSAGAAAALTAAIVIHPLALMGAVATAAAGAGATAMTMWAVGFFHDLDRGYQIWSSEEFGKLFWRDSDEANKGGSGKKNGTEEEEDGSTTVLTEENSQLFILDGEVEVQQLVAPPLDQHVPSLSEMGRAALLDEEQRVNEDDDSVKGDFVGDDNASAALSCSTTSPERLSTSSWSKKQHSTTTSSSRRGYRIRKVGSMKPIMRKIKMQNGLLTRQSTPTLEDDPQLFLSANHSSPNSSPLMKRTPSTSPTMTYKLPSISNHRNIIDRHFPPLEICVIHSVQLPGLDSASQFFNVFFADNAPYSMKDFQKRRGDVDIVYEPWEDCACTKVVDENGGDTTEEDDLLFSFKEKDGSSVIEPLPSSMTRKRRLKFNTLTKSYFGPAYAKATKIQRATQLFNDRVLVIENVTQLSDIPFSDRFRVIERWVLEVVEEEGEECDMPSVKESASSSAIATESKTSTSITICKFSVYAEVQMLKSCSWEPQIRKKASETFTDVATDWCKSAVVALTATEEQKRKRQRVQLEEESGTSAKTVVDKNKSSSLGRRPPRIPSPMIVVTDDVALPTTSTATTNAIIPTSLVRERSKLFAEHKRNFDEFDKLIAQGDLEWCSVEVTHTSHLEFYSSSNISNTVNKNEDVESSSLASSAFATVLEYPDLDEYEITSSIAGSSLDDDDDEEENNIGGSRKKAAALMRTRSRKLLRKLSSKRGGA